MKFNLLVAALLMVAITQISCSAQTTKAVATEKKEPLARKMLKWDNNFVEYGKVKKGDKREHTYKFQNISKEDIDIMICTACDCTTLDWTSKTIKPGEFGEINTIFNSKEKDKPETITITIILKNTDPVLHYPIVDEVKFHFDLIE
jgi:peptidoglycan-associated lipoprotein